MVRVSHLSLSFAALLATAGCAYDDSIGYAPTDYPPGLDSGMGSGVVGQPGDRFGGQNVGNIAVFEAPLAPYGQWLNSRFGRAFRPDARQGWRPYANGRWGENRLWVSEDPWGWATDHYGRWGHDERTGWVWVPGTEWAPSWTAWREDRGQNVAGWAPVPPGVNYSVNLGFGNGWGYDNFNSWYAPSWIWVPRSYVYEPRFGGRVLPWNYGASYWGGSRWQYQPGYGGRAGWNDGGFRSPYGGNWQGRPPGRNGYRGDGYRGDGYRGGGYGNDGYGGDGRGNPRMDYDRSRRTRGGDSNGFTPWQAVPGENPAVAANRQSPVGVNQPSPFDMQRAPRPDRQQPVERAPAPQQYVERAPAPQQYQAPEPQQRAVIEPRGRVDEGNTRPD